VPFSGEGLQLFKLSGILNVSPGSLPREEAIGEQGFEEVWKMRSPLIGGASVPALPVYPHGFNPLLRIAGRSTGRQDARLAVTTETSLLDVIHGAF
jgi:hypothetical protein